MISSAWRTLFLAALGMAAASAQSTRPAEVVVFYDGPQQPLAEGFLDAHHIQNLLGHFGLRADLVPLAEYRPGRLAAYRAAFFLGTVTGTPFPAGFLAEVRASRSPFCWIGRHIGSLTNTPEGRALGFQYVDYRDDLEYRQVRYKGVLLPKEDPDLNLVSIVDSAAVQVLGTAINDEGVEQPYVLRRGRFWYFADTPFSFSIEGDRYLVFCDLLHDILEMDHAPEARALARIEDVSAEIDPGDLRAVADLLASRRIPFQIAVIPIYRNPAKGFEIYLSDRRALVDAIHYMIARGGAPVLHGVTHQYRGASGDDYEFWDEVANRPIARDSAQLVRERLAQGLAECFSNGIYPIAFETPHYGASAVDYGVLQQVFTLFNERTMPTPDVSSIQYFPYPVVDQFGRYVVPENLGYLPLENPDPKVVVERAQRMRVVRDAVASFYFHPFLDQTLLGEMVRGVEQAGYQFVSLRRFGGAVDYQGRYLVRGASGRVRVAPQDEFWRLRVYSPNGQLLSERVSAARLNRPAEVDIQTPAGGWAALDCVREAPKKGDWRASLSQWWSGLRPTRRWLGAGGDFPPSTTAWVLWLEKPQPAELNNQESYRAVLETFGYAVTSAALPLRNLPPAGAILVVPEAAGKRLSPAEQHSILTWVASGGLLVADGRQEWLTALGLRWLGQVTRVTAVTDLLAPDMALHWRPEEQIERFHAPEGAQPLLADPTSQQTLAVAGSHGSGRYLYLAAPFDPHTREGTSHYPYFGEYLAEGFRLRPGPRSPRLEAYFDPGYREGANLNRLVAAWRQAGIRAVYAAAWHSYREYSYDYASLLRACHRNGIAVYAWFVFPAATPKMWDEHPEWRERTAAGTDGRVGWRYSMNFENPACFRASMEWTKELLAAHPWDGVNVTELNFDADFTDYLRPDRFVPMNDDVRAAFRRRSGFDPALLFASGSPYYHRRNPQALEQFLAYREDVVTAWHERVLTEIEPVARARGWEVIVTMLDSLHSRYVRPALGVNSRRLIELMKRFDFTLQVEDPAEHWATSPQRYRHFAETYRALAPVGRLMFDINVVPDRSVESTSLPSATATGTELAETVRAAAVFGRVAIYSEWTVPSQDWKALGTALAAPARLDAGPTGWTLEAPVPVWLTSAEDRDYFLDWRLWPAVSPEGLLAPAGRHRLTIERPWLQLRERAEELTRVLYLSGELLEARSRRTGVEVHYRSP
ncbi:MAG: polysaccharide deacetylase family protein, partial [Acidobacteria bacterium]|nr:polysaccharide deacetylase family protein [Acidobacteriota bacterium]